MKRTIGPAVESVAAPAELFDEAMHDLKLHGFGTTLALRSPAWVVVVKVADVAEAFGWAQFDQHGVQATGTGFTLEQVVRAAIALGAVDLAGRETLDSLSRRPGFDQGDLTIESIVRMKNREEPHVQLLGGLVTDPQLAAQEHAKSALPRQDAAELLGRILERAGLADRIPEAEAILLDDGETHDAASAHLARMAGELFAEHEAHGYQVYLLDCAIINAHPARYEDWRDFMIERLPREVEFDGTGPSL